MNYRHIKVIAIAVLFLIAGLLYSVDRSQDIFLYESSLEVEDEEAYGLEASDSQHAAGVESENSVERTEKPAPPDDKEDSAEETELPQPQIHVHVCGAVKTAGVYLLSADSIVRDAIEAAGGVVEGGAADYLNLAGTVSEGDKIYVPFLSDLDDPYGAAEQALAKPAGSAGQSLADGSGTLVNINTADKAQLMTLSGIGETRAEAIISYRESNGYFQKIEDIMKVSGIKEGAFEKMKDQITV